MSVVTLSSVVDLSKVKMKWLEQYVSEGLNHKLIPATPMGIYRGLYLTQNITSPRLVSVTAGADGRHEAVSQSAVGFSMTYFDAVGVTTVLDLSSALLDSQETVIVLSIVYSIGVSTTATWRAYPLADWNALSSAAQNEFIILGTVNVPAPATNITSAMILPKRRMAAWENAAPGATPWSPIIKNPSFEHGVTAADTVKYSISDWVNRTDLAVLGSFRLGTSTVRSGAKSLEFNKAAGASTARVEQYQEVPVIPGQLVRVTGWVRQLISPTLGSYTFNLYWGDLNSSPLGSTVVTASILSTTDASYRHIDQILAVPASAYVLKTVTIEATGITAGSTGVALVVDDFQIYVETGGPQAIAAAVNSRLKQDLTTALIVEDPATYALGQLAALLRFDKSTPTSEGQLVVERKDQNSAQLPPALELLGRMVNLGTGLLSASDALKARVATPYSTTALLTLLWESTRQGESPGGYTQPATRLYVAQTGNLAITVNAIWGGTTWSKDVNGVAAFEIELTANKLNISFKDDTDNVAWNDVSWTDRFFQIDQIAALATIKNTIIKGDGIHLNNTVQQLQAGNVGQAGLLLDVQSIEGTPVSGFDPFGVPYLRGGHFFEEFDENVLNAAKWGTGGAGTKTLNPFMHELRLQPTTTLNSLSQIVSAQWSSYSDKLPRFRSKIHSDNNFATTSILVGSYPTNALQIGFGNLYLNFDPLNTGTYSWWLYADGTQYNTGLGLYGHSAPIFTTHYLTRPNFIYLAVTSPTTVVVATHGNSETWTADRMVQITLGAPLVTTGRGILVEVINRTPAANPTPPIVYIDFIEVVECNRPDF
jgi:hypothetical protein